MACKSAPIAILDYFFNMLEKEDLIIRCACVDEDGALTKSSEFATFLTTWNVTMETTGGYASCLKGKN